MPACEDCGTIIAFLKDPDTGRWMPPVEPVTDLADGDHFIATGSGTAQAMPQVYRRHRCLSMDELQERRRLARPRALRPEPSEKDRLVAEDRERRRVAAEAAEEAEREARRVAQEEVDARREAEDRKRAKRDRKRLEKNIEHERQHAIEHTPQRLLTIPCRGCGAEAGEACRTDRHGVEPHGFYPHWWAGNPCNERFADGPPAKRVVHPERFANGPWPPRMDNPGRYEMGVWLRDNYYSVFEPDARPDNRWLSAREERTLAKWLLANGSVFEEVQNAGRVDPDVRGVGRPGSEGGSLDGVRGPVVSGDPLPDPSVEALPERPRDPGAGGGELPDRAGDREVAEGSR